MKSLKLDLSNYKEYILAKPGGARDKISRILCKLGFTKLSMLVTGMPIRSMRIGTISNLDGFLESQIARRGKKMVYDNCGSNKLKLK